MATATSTWPPTFAFTRMLEEGWYLTLPMASGGTAEPSALAPEPASTTSAPGGEVDRLEMAFNRDCWVEIRDSTGERLAFGLVKSGSVRRYEGAAPFKITIGLADVSGIVPRIGVNHFTGYRIQDTDKEGYKHIGFVVPADFIIDPGEDAGR